MLDSPIRDRQAERHEATRAEILAAAWELARENGLAAVSLRDVARRVGMRAPSLYTYFESKHAIYDAMFADGCRQYAAMAEAADVPAGRRERVLTNLRAFVEFCVADPARYQLMFQRTIPGFEPSPETWALALEGYNQMRARLAEVGITSDRDIDLMTALGTGLTDQQISNDPGGDRWITLIEDAVDMYLAHIDRQRRRRRK